MNNVIDFKGKKVAPAFAHLAVKNNLGEGVASGFPMLNYRGKVWSLRYQGQTYPFVRPDDGTPLSYLDVVILAAAENVSKTYYPPGEWTEDSAEGPICSSVRGDKPDPGVPQPQSTVCVSCTHYGWTTLPNGRRGKECSDSRRLAVLLMPNTTSKMLGSPLLEPVYIKIPPGSLAALKAYGDQLEHAGFPLPSVLTRMAFAPDKLFQITFDLRQTLDDKEAPLVVPLIDDPRTKRIIGEEPEIREVKPAIAAPIREETGLLGAFASEPAPKPTAKPIPQPALPPTASGAEPEIIPPPRKQRGRPSKSEPKGMMDRLVEVEQTLEEDIFHEPVPEPAAEPEPPPFAAAATDDEDSVLDKNLADLLSRKTDNMLQ